MEEAGEKLSTLVAKVTKKLDKLESDELDDTQMKAYLQTLVREVTELEKALRIVESELTTASMLSTLPDIESQRSQVQLQTSTVVILLERYEKVKHKSERRLLLNLKQASSTLIKPVKISQEDQSLIEEAEILTQAKQTMRNSESLGFDVTDNLSSNREKINKARTRTSHNNTRLSESGYLLDNMLYRENQRDLILKVIKGIGGFFALLFFLKLLF